MPGTHNVANALAAIGAAAACGVPAAEAARYLNGFAGLRRRLETVGAAGGVTVIDDFAHNPDKIAATLDTLHAVPGRLLILFQPHGFGPLRKMRQGFIDVFADKSGQRRCAADAGTRLFRRHRHTGHFQPGTSPGRLRRPGGAPRRLATAQSCGDRLLDLAGSGDRIVVMGARDDTLTDFAHGLLRRLEP